MEGMERMEIEEMAQWDIEAIVEGIVRHLHNPFSLLRARQIGRAWRAACAHAASWEDPLVSSFGRVLGLLRVPQGMKHQDWWQELIAGMPPALKGFCEDRFTLGGEPYSMHLHSIISTRAASRRDMLCHSREAVAESTWAYTMPTPRTRFRISLNAPTHLQVQDGDRLPPGLADEVGGLPLFMQNGLMVEYERLPGSGPVDVPNHYTVFRVGPVLLGCFMLPNVPPQAVGLSNQEQMMGTVVLWDERLVISESDRPPASWVSTDTSPATAAAAAAAAAVPASAPASTSLVVGASNVVATSAAPAPPCTAAAPNVLHATAATPFPTDALSTAGQRLVALTRLTPGRVLQGTVLTNYWIQSPDSELWRGHAMLGSAKVQVLAVGPVRPEDHNLVAGAVMMARLLVELPERRLAVRVGGITKGSLRDEEYAYTHQAVVDVVVRGDGTFAPSHADHMADDRPALVQGVGLIEPPEAQAALGERFEQAGHESPCYEFVRPWPFLLHGIVSGGLLAGVLTHSVLGRAVLCVSEAGLQGLSLAYATPGTATEKADL